MDVIFGPISIFKVTGRDHQRTEAMMSETAKTQQEQAQEALACLEQAYAYYTAETALAPRGEEFVEYYEYAAAA
ncbi:hypothetical protein [Thalassovita sp.]|uniref:hypothetical protein n=1 Tax=Thalassovita sp. TaxID=1979401 RepID=UPI002B279EC2|nr:hypothetical protein [Thalassovita sp.]